MTKDELKRQPTGFLPLAMILVFSSHALPAWVRSMAQHFQWPLVKTIGAQNFEQIIFLVFSVALVCHDPRGYGLRLGDGMRKKWVWVLMICAIPIMLTAVVYPLLPSKPFSGGPISTWLISPLAQDLLFAGFLYRWFSIHFPGKLSQAIPMNRCVVLTAACFSLWHTPNIAFGIGPFIWFQLAYTFFGACLVGVIRQWTDSLLYITIVHMAVNCIAVYG
ncbi:MAG: CPBP family intramembrane glutamic endopeptidase [Fuerstiella sp.]